MLKCNKTKYTERRKRKFFFPFNTRQNDVSGEKSEFPLKELIRCNLVLKHFHEKYRWEKILLVLSKFSDCRNSLLRFSLRFVDVVTLACFGLKLTTLEVKSLNNTGAIDQKFNIVVIRSLSIGLF